MRILFYSDTFGQHTTTFIYNDLKYFESKYNVLFLTRNRFNFLKFPSDNVALVPFTKDSKIGAWCKFRLEKLGLKMDFYDNFFSHNLNNAIRNFKPDLIHIHFGYDAVRFFQNVDFNLIYNIPILIQFHGHDASFHLHRKSYVFELNKIFLLPNVYVTCVSDFLKKNLLNKTTLNKRVEIIFNGVNAEFFDPAKEPSMDSNKNLNFVQTGSLEPKKGHLNTLLAFKLLIERCKLGSEEVKLVFAGGGELEIFLNNKVRELQLDDYVHISGWVSPIMIRGFLSKANIFVHPSITHNNRTEGMPLGILEAMAMNLPIISTYHSGIPEVVENQKNGYLVQENDIEGLSFAMENMIENHQKFNDNRSKILNYFSFEKHVTNLEKYYASLIKS